MACWKPAGSSALFGMMLLAFGVPALVFWGAVAETSAGEPSRPEQCGESLTDIYNRVSPAVVSIAVAGINPHRLSDRVERGVGSGFIIDGSGMVLTNSHVVFGKKLIAVTLDDGTILPGKLLGADPIFDLAVVQIPVPAGGGLPTAPPGDSDRLRVGDEVVGINTAFMAEAQNIGFAIPINIAKAVVPSLLANGRVIRPWLGFQGQLVGEPLRRLLRIPLTDGLLVEVIEPGSPAEKAGLQGGQLEIVVGDRGFLVGGDIVTAINGAPLDSPEHLPQVMRQLKVGDTISLTIFRDERWEVVMYELPERPVLPGDFQDRGSLAPLGGRARPPASGHRGFPAGR